jgi:hypothetical protein
MERSGVTQRDVADDGTATRPVEGETRETEGTRRRLPLTGRRGEQDTAARPMRDRGRDEFGGINWGSAFFGFLVAVGIGVILTALISAAGAAIGLTSISNSDARSNAAAISIGGGILLTLIAAIAYFAGGYVAGRMSRFDGARQGFATWAWGLIITLLIAALGVIAGSQYNVFNGLNLPRIPVDEGSLTTGGAITLGAIFIASLIAAVLGGKAGERYHRRVDEVAYGQEPRYEHGRDSYERDPRHEPAPTT